MVEGGEDGKQPKKLGVGGGGKQPDSRDPLAVGPPVATGFAG